ncbi:MAG: sugar transferase [Bacteroidales bacterium]|nr:sugar transferase [Bacteroidales bacterium]
MYKHFFKSFLDILFSSLALLCIGWFILLVAIFLHFANKGAGAFFLQERPGRDEKIFKIIKFKTMTDERDENGNLLPDKDRITKVGVVVRKLSVDELPQLVNVLKGDMSFIGPRPLLPEYLPWYTEREKLRHTVRPGITGWAQVNGRSNITWDRKLECDAYYVEHISFLTDVRILFKTIQNMVDRSEVVGVIPQGGSGKLNIERANKQMICKKDS